MICHEIWWTETETSKSDYCDHSSCEETNEVAYEHCITEAEEVFIECTNNCDSFDLVCHTDCSDAYHDQLTLCPCKEGCPNGCPCENYECYEEEEEVNHDEDMHMLIFNPHNSGQKPSYNVIKFSMFNTTDGFQEEMHQVGITQPNLFRTEASHMCSFVNNGRMFLAGGIEQYKKKRKFGELIGNEVKQLADLPMDFSRGICAGDIGKDKIAMICASHEHHS